MFVGIACLEVEEEVADLKDEAEGDAEADVEVRSSEAACFTTACGDTLISLGLTLKCVCMALILAGGGGSTIRCGER